MTKANSETPVFFKRNTETKINSVPIEDGQLLFSTDSPKIFFDNEGQRKIYEGISNEDKTQISTNKTNIENLKTVKADKTEIPKKLPNPNALTFTGAISGTYDGSAPLNIDIRGGDGGGSVIKIDNTLTQSGQGADAKVVGDKLKEKLNKNQGAENSGKFLKISNNGEVIPDNIKNTNNYADFQNKPQINGIELNGNKSLEDLSIQPKGNYLTQVPKSSSNVLGGIKTQNKTNETVKVVTDSNGNAYVPTYPIALKNPQPLRFTGAVTETYDGSSEKTINIPMPSGGGSGQSIEQFVSPEQFGAKGDGVTDDSNAFKQAILSGKKVVCMPKKTYNFKSVVDCRTIYKGYLDLNGSLLKGFHILINLNDVGNDWRQSYPPEKFVIKNGEIGGTWSEKPINWDTPVIKTGTQMRLQHLKFTNEPYMMAIVNQYLDYMLFEDCLYIENHSLFGQNVLKLDAVNVIGTDGNAKRIDGTAQNLAGDAWVFKQCNEWYSQNSLDYKMIAFHNNSNATMMNCIQSGFRLGGSFSDYARVTCISCHWEEAGSMPVLGGNGSTLYLCSALFLGCFFWGNYRLFNFKSVQYINCLFTQTIDNYRLPHIDFSDFTGGKFIYELDCILQNCCVGGNYIVDTKDMKNMKNDSKKTYNKFMNYLSISNFSVKVMENWQHAKFKQIGQYTYDMHVLATELSNYSYNTKTQQVNVSNERTQVTALLGNAVGGFGVRIIRTSPNGELHESILYSDSVITTGDDGNPVAKNLVFHDYGEWCDFGFNDDVKTQLPNIWKKITKKPTIIKNEQMLEANGVLITKDNSNIMTDISGMIQIKKQ